MEKVFDDGQLADVYTYLTRLRATQGYLSRIEIQLHPIAQLEKRGVFISMSCKLARFYKIDSNQARFLVKKWLAWFKEQPLHIISILEEK
jgi:hypothetical protein